MAQIAPTVACRIIPTGHQSHGPTWPNTIVPRVKTRSKSGRPSWINTRTTTSQATAPTAPARIAFSNATRLIIGKTLMRFDRTSFRGRLVRERKLYPVWSPAVSPVEYISYQLPDRSQNLLGRPLGTTFYNLITACGDFEAQR